jgi:hypothetical protein
MPPGAPTAASSEWQSGLRAWVVTRPYTLITLLLLVALGVGAIGRKTKVWDRVYVGSARALLHGQDIYQDKLFTYPPFSALFHIPFTVLPAWPGRFIWYLICAGSLIYLCGKSWQLAGGPRLECDRLNPGAGRREQIAFVLGQVCALQFILNALTHLQTDLLIAALLTAGCAAIAEFRFFRAATWIGVATAFRATPLLFAPYLLWRRQWLAAFWLVAVAIGLNVLPDVIHQPPGGGDWLVRWSRLYLAPMQKPDYIPGDWKNQLDNNQGLAGLANRWFATRWQAGGGDFKVLDRPGHLGAATIRGVFLAMCLAVVLPVAWIEWRRRKAQDPPDPIGSFQLPNPHMIECGMVLLLMLLLSPNSSRAHFCIMILPAFCAARIAVNLPAPAVRWLLGLALVCSTLSIHLRLSATLVPEQFLLWVGVVTFSTLFLLLACIVALWKWYPPPSAQSLLR